MSCSISWKASLVDSESAFGPRKASKVEKPSSRGVSSLHRVVPIASTSSLAHALALSAHMYVCLLLCVYSALRGCHIIGLCAESYTSQ